MAQREKDDKSPAPDQPIDARAALAYAQEQERNAARTVQALRAYVEADSKLKSMEARAASLEQRSAELEAELPTLKQRVTDARAMAASAETTAREAYAKEVEAVRAAIGDEQVKLAEMRQQREAEARSLEAAYAARTKQLADATADAERRLAKIKEEITAIVARHAPPA